MIKDTTQLQGFNNIKLPKIKGEVEIRLHNPTTGKTEIQRGENMVTNAISDIFASNYAGAMDYRKMLPLWEKMYGGVLCFRKPFSQEELVATDYFIPTADSTNGNPVTAHAGQSTVSDQTDDPSRGSKSAGNMSITDGTVKLAFEWGLSEGIGDIAALSLTHSDVGTGGTGSSSNAFKGICSSINANYNTTFSQLIYFVDSDGYGYYFEPKRGSTATNIIVIYKMPLAYSQVGLVGQAFAVSSDTQGTPIQYVSEIETGTTYAHYTSDYQQRPSYVFDKTTNKLWLFYNTDATNSVSVDVLDLSDFGNITNTHYDWTLGSTDATKVGALNNPHYAMQLPSDGTYVYLPAPVLWSGTAKFVRVKMVASPADISVIATPSGYTQQSGIFIPNKPNRIIAGKDFVINTNSSGSPILYPCTVGAPDTWGWYDISRRYSNYTYLDGGDGLAKLAWCTYQSPYYMSISKFYLATKFNLPSPVSKTAAQSMIVTYTLTEVEPNG